MAVLQKIRKRSGLLLLAIGFALLAFVVQDLFTKGFKSQSNNVGSINGKDITFESFRMKVANAEKNGQQGQPVSQIQAANQVWDQETSIALLNEEFDKLGIRIGDKHIIDNFTKDPNIGQNKMFQNELGKFDLNKFKEFFKANPGQEQYLADREKEAELNCKYQIYSTMLKAGMYTTNAEGKFKYELEANKVSFDYVSVLYSSIKDSDIKLTDADYIDYMKKHEKRYKSEGTREIEYVLIEDKPSAKDEGEVESKIKGFLTATDSTSFRSTPNVAEFLANNSDMPYDTIYKSKQDLPPTDAEKLFATPTGEIYGPYMNGKFYCISKVMGRKAGAKAKASHILISYEGTQVPNKKEKRTKEQAKAKAESLLAQALASPNNFFILALTNSDDSSAQQGGDLGYFEPGRMVKPFNDFVFSNPVGKIGLVETDFGYHIINVTDKEDAIRLATLGQKIEPSQETTDKAYAAATKFEMDATTKDFAVVAKAAKLNVNPAIKAKPMDESFGSVGNQRQIVKWAYTDDTKIGDVKRFEIVNVGHVIAKLSKINEKGLMSVEDAKPIVESILKNQKKAEKIIAKMKGGSLEAIATANKTTVQQAADVTIENPTVGAIGVEQKVVGTAFGLAAGKTSAPIEGNMGVFVVRTKAVVKAPKLPKYTEFVAKLKGNASQASGRAIGALKSDAKIEDNRLEFY